MSNQEISNRTVKALAIAQVLKDQGVAFEVALSVKIDQGPFWPAVVKATGRKDGKISEGTRKQALYFLAAMGLKRATAA